MGKTKHSPEAPPAPRSRDAPPPTGSRGSRKGAGLHWSLLSSLGHPPQTRRAGRCPHSPLPSRGSGRPGWTCPSPAGGGYSQGGPRDIAQPQSARRPGGHASRTRSNYEPTSSTPLPSATNFRGFSHTGNPPHFLT